MSPEYIKIIMSYVGTGSVGAIAGGTVIYYVLKSFVPTYLNKKAENLATREDIAKITDEIERVRSQYTLVLEELKARHQLRLAAVERRLEAHQQAYTLWQELLSNIHTESIGCVVVKCQDWWNNNCLYLTPEARSAFNTAFHCALTHKDYKSTLAIQNDLVERNWDRIIAAGEAIVKGVELPSLGEAEFKIENLPTAERGALTE